MRGAGPARAVCRVERTRYRIGPVDDPIHANASWDAGAMGCGELVFLLMQRLGALAPGEVLKLTATDPGAPHDIPAWCRLTANPLLRAEPPHYYIQRKD
jgi:tRNA 2-thiouridine synthesizing protein A